MLNYIKHYIKAHIVTLWVLLFSACGDPMIAIDKPFSNAREAITTGQTSREGVHMLLGLPSQTNNVGNTEAYRSTGDAIGLVAVFPFPSGDLTHHALISYDASDRVIATDWGYDSGHNPWNGITLYAGDYGYFTGTSAFFPSKDSGGKADKAWVSYLSLTAYYRRTNEPRTREYALSWLCRAADRGQPAAFNELGNNFWEGSFVFDDGINERPPFATYKLWYFFNKDNVKACSWYSMANDKVLPSWCHEVLTAEEAIKVKYLLDDWKPSQCERDIATLISSMGITSDTESHMYWNDPTNKDAMKSLCHAADSGHSEAQYTLGQMYESGSTGIPKDSVRAYMWYLISVSTGGGVRAEDQANHVHLDLNQDQARQAEILIREWMPGQCARDLIFE